MCFFIYYIYSFFLCFGLMVAYFSCYFFYFIFFFSAVVSLNSFNIHTDTRNCNIKLLCFFLLSVLLINDFIFLIIAFHSSTIASYYSCACSKRSLAFFFFAFKYIIYMFFLFYFVQFSVMPMHYK